MTMTLVYILAGILGLLNSGCSGGGGGSANAPPLVPVVVSPTATPVATPTQVASSPTATPQPTATPVAVDPTVYSLTYMVDYASFTGSCMQYGSNTYCWDDGFKQACVAPGNCHYSFWQVTTAPGSCDGNCTSDLLTNSPTLVDTNLISYMQNSLSGATHTTPSFVLSTGTPQEVSCSLLGNILTCPTFSINLAQVSL